MPNVTVDNPKVQIDLETGESTTVPTGQRFKVSLMAMPGFSEVALNGKPIAAGNGQDTTAHVRTDLFGGDTILAEGNHVRIRGYRVD